jgi:thiosulfate/3-mercaptopyruvate sulfurtransferase
LYGDKNNWWATYAFWVFQLFGHTNAKIMNGGRQKWIEEGRALTREVPSFPPSNYQAPQRDDTRIRAFRDHVMALLAHGQGQSKGEEEGERQGRREGQRGGEGYGLKEGVALVDVRSSPEYTGEMVHMVNYPQEGAQRGGHIPGAQNIPWATAVREDGTFKSAQELRAIYEGKGVTADKEVVAYCRIGERSSHTWFVLTYLLGYPNVRNYDGSWTEWGNLVDAPIETGQPSA